MITKEEINYVLQSDTSVRLKEKMFSLFCKSPLFKPELIQRSSFKSALSLICRDYEDYVVQRFDVSNYDQDSNKADYLVAIQSIKKRYPNVKNIVQRLREQAIFYDYLYGVLDAEESADEEKRRLFNIFVRMRGIGKFANMEENEIKESWEKFKANGLTTAEDWQCLFI